MRSTRISSRRLITVAALVALPLVSLAACSDSPMQLKSQPAPSAQSAQLASDAGSLVKVGSSYLLAVQHPCSADSVASLLTASPFSTNTANLMNNGGGGTNPCNCPPVVPPPSRLPGWTCTLKTWECAPGTGSTCYYTCTAPITRAEAMF
jgi:hypothetical protein